jgi:hypothetical protein
LGIPGIVKARERMKNNSAHNPTAKTMGYLDIKFIFVDQEPKVETH